jgi:hypothetical protein
MLPPNVTRIPATLEQFLEESPSEWFVNEATGKVSDVIPDFVPNPLFAQQEPIAPLEPTGSYSIPGGPMEPEPIENIFKQAPAAMIAHIGDVLEVKTLLAQKQPKPIKQKKLRVYCFDASGKIYQGEKYTSEQWEALKRKLGAVIEVEAPNQVEAWKKYEQVVNEKGEQG